jgi:hypothetical protein
MALEFFTAHPEYLARDRCNGLPGEWRPGSSMPSRSLRMRTTKLYDWTKDEITIGEVERIQV